MVLDRREGCLSSNSVLKKKFDSLTPSPVTWRISSFSALQKMLFSPMWNDLSSEATINCLWRIALQQRCNWSVRHPGWWRHNAAAVARGSLMGVGDVTSFFATNMCVEQSFKPVSGGKKVTSPPSGSETALPLHYTPLPLLYPPCCQSQSHGKEGAGGGGEGDGRMRCPTSSRPVLPLRQCLGLMTYSPIHYSCSTAYRWGVRHTTTHGVTTESQVRPVV